ncbi:MAG: diacylglycerol kinase family protein [Bacteroidota bacterium]
MKKVSLIIHGKSKKGKTLKEKITKALSAEFQINEKFTEYRDHAIELAKNEVNNGTDFIISCGGDGLLNEVTNGVMFADKDKRQKVVVGLFPLGTGNDFARTVNISKSPKDLTEIIEKGTNSVVDVGRLEFHGENGNKKVRFFQNITDIGIGAKSVELVNKSKKTLGARLTFVISVLRSFIGYKQQQIKLKANDFEWSGKIVSVCLANGHYFGSGLGIAPDAKLNDGKLSLIIIGDMRIIHFLKYLPHLRKLKKVVHPEVHYRTVNWCEISSDEAYPVDMDGDNPGYTPLRFEVMPSAIRFLSNYK